MIYQLRMRTHFLRGALTQRAIREVALPFLESKNPVLHCVFNHKTLYKDWSSLTEAMDAIESLPEISDHTSTQTVTRTCASTASDQPRSREITPADM
jgi:hypothetical protein